MILRYAFLILGIANIGISIGIGTGALKPDKSSITITYLIAGILFLDKFIFY